MQPAEHLIIHTWPQHRSGQQVSLLFPAANFSSTLFITEPQIAYQKNIANWSTSSTPPPRTASRRSRTAKSSNLAPAPATPATPTPATLPHIQPITYQPAPPIATIPVAPPLPADPRSARSRAPLPTIPQAIQSTYASRLQTGATLLVQPILSGSSTVAAAVTVASTSTRPRRGGVVSYADPGSGDDIPDAGEVDSDGSDFVASGGTRTAIRAARGTVRVANGGNLYAMGTPAAAAGASSRTELDQSYLGLIPPSRFITAKQFAPTKHGDLWVSFSPLLIETVGNLIHAVVAQRNGSLIRQGDQFRLFPFALNSRRTHTAFAIVLSGIYMNRWSRRKSLRAHSAQISIYRRHHGQIQSQRRSALN